MLTVSAGVSAPYWGDLELHIHHYMWAAMLSHFACFNHPVSVVFQAFCLGVVTQQMTGRGVVGFFDNMEADAGGGLNDTLPFMPRVHWGE